MHLPADEREAILKHFTKKQTSPITNQAISNLLIPNRALKHSIDEWHKSKASKDEKHYFIESDVKDLCFEDDKSAAEEGMRALLTNMKYHRVALSKMYVDRLVDHYKGKTPSIQMFLDTNREISERANRLKRYKDEVSDYLAQNTSAATRKLKCLDTDIEKTEQRLKRLRCSKRTTQCLIDQNARLAKLYDVDAKSVAERHATAGAKRKRGDADTDTGQLARELLIDAMKFTWTDEHRVFLLVKLSGRLGNTLAKIICKMKGLDMRQNLEGAFSEFEEYARTMLGSNEDDELLRIARYFIGVCKVHGWGTQKHEAAGYSMLRDNAVDGGCWLSQVFLSGFGEDEEQKRFFALKALDGKNSATDTWASGAAAAKMALAYHKTDNLLELDDGEVAQRVTSWMRQGANAGVRMAEYWMGRYAYGGYGMPQDIDVAAQWLRKSAEKHYSPAMFELGRLMIETVEETELVDGGAAIEEAIGWIQKSADDDYVWAQRYLDSVYTPAKNYTRASLRNATIHG